MNSLGVRRGVIVEAQQQEHRTEAELLPGSQACALIFRTKGFPPAFSSASPLFFLLTF